MNRKGEAVGRFSVELEVANNLDVAAARRGTIAEDAVRRASLHGIVDSGATRLVLPPEVTVALGLRPAGEVGVRYADGRRATRAAVGDVEVAIQGRSSVFTAVVEPGRTDALVGAIVLEELDFVVDCISRSLVPRDPERIFAEIE